MCDFGKDEWNSILGGGLGGGLDGGVIEIKKDMWGYVEWENESSEVGLVSIDLDWKYAVSVIDGNRRIKYIKELRELRN